MDLTFATGHTNKRYSSNENLKALIAMSGGVDSSVTAFLMKEHGFDCIGATMKLFPNGNPSADARHIADRLDIPHHILDFTDEFDAAVIQKFVEAYESGDTPNPCAECNRHIKFGKLLSKATELGCDFMATGHYARTEWDNERACFSLKKALDETKDQSYFLYSITQEQLARVIFPLGKMRKKEVRDMATAQGFLNAQKRESQDICFIPDGDYANFIEQRARNSDKGHAPGDFIDLEGKSLGRHKGLIRYTIGQRKGLGLAHSHPLYVCAKNVGDNTVTLGGEEALYTTTVEADSFNWIRPKPTRPVRVMAKTRYRQAEQWATVVSAEGDLTLVEFDKPQKAVAPGQALVLYDGEDVVGGGTIKHTNRG